MASYKLFMVFFISQPFHNCFSLTVSNTVKRGNDVFGQVNNLIRYKSVDCIFRTQRYLYTFIHVVRVFEYTGPTGVFIQSLFIVKSLQKLYRENATDQHYLMENLSCLKIIKVILFLSSIIKIARCELNESRYLYFFSFLFSCITLDYF